MFLSQGLRDPVPLRLRQLVRQGVLGFCQRIERYNRAETVCQNVPAVDIGLGYFDHGVNGAAPDGDSWPVQTVRNRRITAHPEILLIQLHVTDVAYDNVRAWNSALKERRQDQVAYSQRYQDQGYQLLCAKHDTHVERSLIGIKALLFSTGESADWLE